MFIIIIIIKSVSVLVSLFDADRWVLGAGGGRYSALRLWIAHWISALILPLDELFVVSPKHKLLHEVNDSFSHNWMNYLQFPRNANYPMG